MERPEGCPGRQPFPAPGRRPWGWVTFLGNASALGQEGYVNTAARGGSQAEQGLILGDIMMVLLSMEKKQISLRLFYVSIFFDIERHHFSDHLKHGF